MVDPYVLIQIYGIPIDCAGVNLYLLVFGLPVMKVKAVLKSFHQQNILGWKLSHVVFRAVS